MQAIDNSGNETSCDFILEVAGCDQCATFFEFSQDCYEVAFNPTLSGFQNNISYEWSINSVVESEAPSFSINEGPGSYEVCLTAMDNVCTDTYCETITVNEILTDITNCPVDQIILNTDQDCSAIFNPPLNFTNTCLNNPLGEYSLNYVRSDGFSIEDVFPVGTTSVLANFTGDYGEISTCEFVVEVVDNIPPECNVQNIIVSTEGETGVSVSFPFQAFDNCQNPIITYSSPSGIFYECGTYSIIAEVQDQSGNMVECDFILEVGDCDECCQSASSFINITDEDFTLSSSFIQDNCKFILETPDLSACQYITKLDWGDGTNSELMLSSDVLIEHTYTESGIYEVCVTYEERNITDSCFINTTCDRITINDDCTFSRSPEILVENKLLVYPNPSIHSVQVKFIGNEEIKIRNVKIYSSTAKLIYEKNDIGRRSFLIEDSILELGIYFLQVELTNGVFLHDKILKR